jgi:hypothetical protein
MARNPKEQWERLQVILQNRAGKGGFGFGGGFPGGGRGGFGVTGALIVLGLGGWALSNSLFNGEDAFLIMDNVKNRSADLSFGEQLMVVTVPSSTRE